MYEYVLTEGHIEGLGLGLGLGCVIQVGLCIESRVRMRDTLRVGAKLITS